MSFSPIVSSAPIATRAEPEQPPPDNADARDLASIEQARKSRMQARYAVCAGLILSRDETCSRTGLAARDLAILARNGRGPRRFVTSDGAHYYPESEVSRWVREGD